MKTLALIPPTSTPSPQPVQGLTIGQTEALGAIGFLGSSAVAVILWCFRRMLSDSKQAASDLSGRVDGIESDVSAIKADTERRFVTKEDLDRKLEIFLSAQVRIENKLDALIMQQSQKP